MTENSEIRIQKFLGAVAASFFLFLAVLTYPAIAQHLIGSTAEGHVLHGYAQGLSAAFLVNGLFVLGVGWLRRMTWLKFLAMATSTLILVEAGLAAGIYFFGHIAHTGTEFHQRIFGGFDFHPSLGGVPKPNYYYNDQGVEISHNAHGFRGTDVDPSAEKKRLRVAAVGGSSTYDIGVSDDQTWTFKLDGLLGDDAEVLNFGIPGHASAEHVILTSLRLSEYRPDVVLFYVGVNDIRMSHARVLRPDYSAFHLRRHYSALGVDVPYRPLATLTAINLMRQFVPNTLYAIAKSAKGDGPISGEVDLRLLEYFTRNIRMLISATRVLGAEPVFIPQLMNTDIMTTDETGGWVRNIPEKDVPAVQDAFNRALIETAKAEGAAVIDGVLDPHWDRASFIDSVHFSPPGAEAFARIVAKALIERGIAHRSAGTGSPSSIRR